MFSMLLDYNGLQRNQPVLQALLAVTHSACLPLQDCKLKTMLIRGNACALSVNVESPLFLDDPGLRNQRQASLKTERSKEGEARVDEK